MPFVGAGTGRRIESPESGACPPRRSRPGAARPSPLVSRRAAARPHRPRAASAPPGRRRRNMPFVVRTATPGVVAHGSSRTPARVPASRCPRHLTSPCGDFRGNCGDSAVTAGDFPAGTRAISGRHCRDGPSSRGGPLWEPAASTAATFTWKPAPPRTVAPPRPAGSTCRIDPPDRPAASTRRIDLPDRIPTRLMGAISAKLFTHSYGAGT